MYVFLFFGIVAVLGSYFVAARTIPSWILLLPACGIGMLSIGVLNVNNMRDMNSDEGIRITIPLRIGLRNARIYQTILVCGGIVCITVYSLLRFPDPWHYLYLVTLPLFAIHLHGIWTRQDEALDPMLPLLVISTFALSLLAGAGYLVFLLGNA